MRSYSPDMGLTLGRRLALLLICAGAASAGTVAVVRATSGSTTATGGPRGTLGPGPPTLAQPLPAGAHKVSLADAATAFGAPLVLPDTAQATPSDAGAVWINPASAGDPNAGSAVAVTFPAQDMLIDYTRPGITDMAAFVQNNVQTSPGSQAITLNGAPALNIPQVGSDWGSIMFVVGGTTVTVSGHADEASLQAVAQSILDRATTTG